MTGVRLVGVRLPSVDPPEPGSVGVLLAQRRSVRQFSEAPVALDAVGRLLWAGQGAVTDGKRTAPSAGGLHPLGLTVVAGAVAGLGAGVYRYVPGEHVVEAVSAGDLRDTLCAAAIGPQPWLSEAALVIVVSGDVEQATEHFADQSPDRGARYVHMETGAVAQNVALQAVALDLGVVMVGGFDDDAVRGWVPAGHDPLALLAVGCPAGD